MKYRHSNRHSFVRVLFVLSLAAMLLTAIPARAQGPVGKSFPPSEGTLWGEPQDLGNGQIQTFVTLDSSNIPSLVGVYFTEGALSGLPETPSDGQWDVVDPAGNVVIPCCGHEVVLDFSEVDEGTIPFEHFVINWNPMGHLPVHVYDVPHFDLHFYTISNDERIAIETAAADTMCSVPNPPDIGGEHPVPVSCETFEQAVMPLPEDQMPVGYISVGEVAPGMGNHLIHMQAPELAGEPFTQTWIYGSYAGRLTFYEPMIANAFLEERNEEVCADIPMPEAMPEPGYYPTRYCTRYAAGHMAGDGAFTVTLENFVEF